MMNRAALSLCLLSATLLTAPAYAQQQPGAALQLPQIDPLTQAASQSAVPAIPATTQPTAPATTSMGDVSASLFFTPEQVILMREALNAHENRVVTPTAGAPANDTNEGIIVAEKPKVAEPETYPIFYLSSIVFHDKKDWSIWVSGHKITSQKNNTDLKVVGITADAVTFAWQPTYTEPFAKRWASQKFSSTDEVKHKLTSTPQASYDEQTGIVTFRLKPNQSFIAGYMSTFEGFVDSPTLSSLDDAAGDNDANTETLLPTTRATIRQLSPEEATATRAPKSLLDRLNSPEGQETIGALLEQAEAAKKAREAEKNAP